ncbi:spore germination protein [Fodinisporobacter ferrooxydans]|uniref:Spore germination protein n=1 Tax=Fodinisporobacter ferrooxydans TaxID=2901836 RepID=A0ABY4CIJ1_9BACL|nr:spore germination protein [Alicyclobacillaceae bacterium MYW30-H2]
MLQKRARKKLENRSSTNFKKEDQKFAQILSFDLEENINLFQNIYTDCSDVIFRSFLIGNRIEAVLIYIDGLANLEDLETNLLAPLMQNIQEQTDIVDHLKKNKIAVAYVQEFETIDKGIESILRGNPLLLLEGEKRALSLGLAKWEKRSIEEPTAEGVVRGPRDGFVETLRVNTSLLRRKIKSPDLKLKSMKIGRYTQTDVVIAYIEGLVEQTLLEEVQNRLQRIDLDGVLESGYIEEFIEDCPFSPFPQVINTERPDVVAANLLEGRVAILMDETPFVLIAPTTFFSLLQSPEDYYQRFLISTLIRWLRYLFMGISLLLPSLYVAILTFHQEMVPASLLVSIAGSRETVPFPALVEALIMEVTFEALREAGIRLPKQIGSAVSIVGALVIGQAAVQAGLVSTPLVIVVAVTGIASFMVPRYVQGTAFRMIRFPIMFLAGTLGLLGVMFGVIALSIHLCTLRSFGVPYMSPVGPVKMRNWKDVLIRAPWWMMSTRPHLTGEYDPYRQSIGQMPNPSRGGE